LPRVVDIFDEVSDDLRTERAVRLARRYGGLLLLACLAVLIAVAADQFYEWHTQKQDQGAAARYLAITSPLDAAGLNLTTQTALGGAKALTDFAASAPAGYATIADLRAAALYANAGQPSQAEALWSSIGNDTAADPLLRDLATLLWAQHEAGHAPDAEVLGRLAPLASQQNPYHGLAQETQALIYMGEGKSSLAKALFSQIAADPNVPDGVRNRADGLLEKLNG